MQPKGGTLLFSIILASGCGGGSAAQIERALSGGTAIVNTANDLDSIDPTFSYTETGWQIEYATCLKLLNYVDAEGTPQLVADGAASLPAVSPDGTVYTFTIASGNSFSDGTPVTASSFKRAFVRAMNPDHKNGGRPGGQLFLTDVKSVTVDGNTLTITLQQAAGDFLQRAAMPFFCAVPEGTPMPIQSTPIPAAGPYYIASYSPVVYDADFNVADIGSLTLKRNPYYYGLRPRVLDEIDYVLGIDPEAQVAGIESGSVDYLAEGVPPDQRDSLVAAYGSGADAQMQVHPILGYFYLALNTSRSVFANSHLRQAVNYALDRTPMAQILGLQPNDDMLPPGMPGYASYHPYLPTNVSKAVGLMAGATPTVELYYRNAPPAFFPGPQDIMAPIVQAQLALVGFTVNLHPIPTRQYYQVVGAPGAAYDLAFGGWLADYADPVDFFYPLLDGNAIAAQTNLANFNDSAFNDGVAAAQALTPENGRFAAFTSLDRQAIDKAPLAVIGNYNSYDFFSSRMSCKIYNAVYGIDLATLCTH
jgi:peptide/nickel transport system substrate-binding protein